MTRATLDTGATPTPRRGRGQGSGANGSPELADRIAALDEAVAVAEGRLDSPALDRVREVRAKTDERLAQGAQAVVVALAGGTGSGKSSLFNALAGSPLSQVGARRPVTEEVTGWVVGDPAASADLLDWLHVGRRHHVPPGPRAPEGMVLLDLPDHDSVATGHRLLVDRFVERVDLLVWVVDPRKYAQRALHEGYLRVLAEHAEVVHVVLNQVDGLTAAERDACLVDLRRLLGLAGLHGVRLHATSAATGEGVEELAAVLAEAVRERRAMGDRLAADLRTAGRALQEETGPAGAADLGGGADLVDALADAAGIRAFSTVAAREYRRDARAATRPLLSRAVWALPSRVLRPLRMPGGRPRRAVVEGDTAAGRADTGVTPPSPVAVRHALLGLADRGGAQLPPSWAAWLRGVAARAGSQLGAAIARALDGVSLDPGRRRWWRPVAVLWSSVEAVALAGAGWLAVLAVLAYLQLPRPPVPDAVGALPWPTALLLGGGVVWLLVGAVRNRLVAAGAQRQERRTLRAAHDAIEATVERDALAPLRAELAAHDELAAALERVTR